MIRAVGVPEVVQALAGPLVVIFALVTQLGDVWFLFALVAGIYWLGSATPLVGRGLDRERAALVVALFVGSVALAVSLKAAFAFERPPGAGDPPQLHLIPPSLRGVYAWFATAEGYGFPSGHAIGSTLVYGGLARLSRAGRARHRYAVAACVIGLVWLSRLALGVHYLVDVLAGGAVALVYLAVVLRARTPRRAFALAVPFAFLALAVDGLTAETGPLLGLTVGALATWLAFGRELAFDRSPRAARLTATLGVVVAVPLFVGAVALDVPVALRTVLAAVGSAVTVALPLVGERAATKERA